MNHSRYNVLLITTLILLGVGVYFFNLNNQLFWDDDDWIINNNPVHSLSWENIKFWFSNNVLAGVGLESNYYRPFLFFTFALNWVLSESKPFLWHLASNSIHIANAVLVFVLLKKFAGRTVAFLTALIFTIHPLNTEAVAYISGRGDPLSAFFMLLGLLFFVKDIKSTRAIRYKLLAIGSLVLAILSRETGIIFPILALTLYASVLSRYRFLESIKVGLVKTWPYFAVVIVYSVLRLTVLNFQNTLNFYTVPNLYSENLLYRLLTFMHVLVDYFRLLFVPVGLHMERSVIVHTSLFQWPVWLGALVVSCIVYLIFRFYRKEIIQNTRHEILNTDYRVWFFGWGWFFIGLAMVSGIVPINALMYEHWLYLPMIGFWLIISFYLVRLFDYLRKNQKPLFVICILLFGAYLSFFGLQSIKRNILWGKPIEFYEDILKYEPDNVRISNNLGNMYFNQEDKERAEFYYRQAVDAESDFAQPYFNLGGILQSKGDIQGAIQLYERAKSVNPNFFYAYQNLAVVYAQQGDFIKAVQNIEALKLLLPSNPRIYYNSALVYIALNNREKAIADLEEGLKYTRFDPETGELIKELIEELRR